MGHQQQIEKCLSLIFIFMIEVFIADGYLMEIYTFSLILLYLTVCIIFYKIIVMFSGLALSWNLNNLIKAFLHLNFSQLEIYITLCNDSYSCKK